MSVTVAVQRGSVGRLSRAHGVHAGSLRAWLAAMLHAARRPRASVAVGLVGDATMRRLNARYAGRRTATDILSFAATPGEAPDLGCLVVALPYVVRQCRRDGIATRRWMPVLLAHGLCHLLGFSHDTRRSGTAVRAPAAAAAEQPALLTRRDAVQMHIMELHLLRRCAAVTGLRVSAQRMVRLAHLTAAARWTLS